MFDPETMRRRFHELAQKRDAITAKSGPLRVQRDALIAAHEAQVRPLEAQIKAAEAGLYDISREIGIIARALNGKTGAA